MNPDVVALFRELADRSPAEREEHYAREQVPEAVRAEVESLLRYDDVADDSLRGFVAAEAEKVLFRTPAPGPSSGSGMQPDSHQQPDSIARFKVMLLLGRGGMGEVYLGHDPVLDRSVAIKLISGANDQDARKRLAREARAAARLRHPNIVTIFEAGEHEGRSYIAMEYVRGETLGSMIRRRAAISLRRRLELIEGACAGLAHAHRQSVIHLDIKPDNLMLDETGVLKVLDFGIARVLQSETMATGHAGTLRYMSPEQVEGEVLDHRSDVFSLGSSLFELISYTPAYRGSTKEIVTRIAAGPVPSLSEEVPDIDPRLEEIVRRAMSVDPAERFADLEELRTELAAVRADIDPATDDPALLQAPAEGAPVAHTPRSRSHSSVVSKSRSRTSPPARLRTAAQRQRSRFVVPAAAAGILLIGAGSFVAWQTWRTPYQQTAAPPPAATDVASTPPSASTVAPDRASAPPAAEPVATVPPIVVPPSPTASESSEARDEVWRRLAAGDRDGVVGLLQSSARGRRGAAASRLPSDVVSAVKSNVLVLRSRANDAGPSATSTPTYHAAEDQLARASRLEAAGQPIEALRALWQAADLYVRPLVERQPLPLPSPLPAPAAEGTAVATTRAPEPVPSPPVETPKPQPAPSPEAPPSPPPSVAAKPVEPPSDTEAVVETLRRYLAAYEALDVEAVLRVFPSLGRGGVEQLRRTFDGMSRYETEMRNPRVVVQQNTATVTASIVRRMTPRVGRPENNEVENVFRLQRGGSGWIIVSVSAR